MWDRPDFLDLPARPGKPRVDGLTHVLDKGVPIPALDGVLAQAGELIDVLKIGWGIAYVDRTLKQRIALCDAAGILVSLGGTLLEVAANCGRVEELRRWALEQGIGAVEVSNGLGALTLDRKVDLVKKLASDFTVLAETGAKDGRVPVVPVHWVDEMRRDLDAGARWVIAEGRESGTVGLFRRDGSVREELVEAIANHVPLDRVIFEAPLKAQQAWFIRFLGPGVNLGNVPPEEMLPLETLRLGLRADTAPFSPVVEARVLAGPEHTRWVEAPEVDVGNATALARRALAEDAPGVRAYVVMGRYQHVNFIWEPTPVVVRVTEVIPPEPPKLLAMAEQAVAFDEELPPIELVLDAVDIRDLAAANPAPSYLLPCRGSGIDLAAPVAFLDTRPATREPWLLIGCERSLQLHRHFYGDEPDRVDLCPRNRASASGPTLAKCCLLERGMELGDAVAVVPWGSNLDEVRQALRWLAGLDRPQRLG